MLESRISKKEKELVKGDFSGYSFTKKGTEYIGIKRSFRILGYEIWLIKVYPRGSK